MTTKTKPTFGILDSAGIRFPCIEHSWIERRLVDLTEAPASLTAKNNQEYEAIYDAVTVEREGMAMCLVSFQKHKDGNRYAVIRNYNAAYPNRK